MWHWAQSVYSLLSHNADDKIWPVFQGKNRCVPSVTHQLRHIHKLVLAVIIHGWCWRLCGRNKRQVINVLRQTLCKGDTQRQPSSCCYLKMSVCVWERRREIIKTGVCLHMLMVCDYSLLADSLLRASPRVTLTAEPHTEVSHLLQLLPRPNLSNPCEGWWFWLNVMLDLWCNVWFDTMLM